MEIFLSIAIGIGLSAACGFRVFVPLLILSVAGKLGAVPIAEQFQWVTTFPAITCFSVATLCEVVAYFVPYFDHLLDIVTTPLAIVAGTITTAAVMANMDPWLQWSLAIIAGGGLATAAQASTVSIRAGSTMTTGGLANPLFAMLETVGSIGLSAIAVFIPIATAFVIIAGFLLVAIFLVRNRLTGRITNIGS